MKQTKIVILVALLLLAACNRINHGGDGGLPTDREIHSGIFGVRIEAGNMNVLEDEAFKYVVKLYNEGATDVTNAMLKLNVNRDFFEVLEPEKNYFNFDLDGKSIFNPFGRSKIFEFRVKALGLSPGFSQSHSANFIIEACYYYNTELSIDVCVDKDVYSTSNNPNKACRITMVTPPSRGQGAPVEITRIEPKFITEDAGITPQYIIYVRNSGRGNVFKSGEMEVACGSGELQEDQEVWNIITVKAKLGNNEMVCSTENEGFLKLEDHEEGSIKCKLNQPLQINEAYKTELAVNLSYGYTETVSRIVTISRV